MTHRRNLRVAGLAAMRGAFPGLSEKSISALAINTGNLPCWALATPRETSTAASKDSLVRQVVVLVVVKRAGDELEDQLDDDAAAIEAAVIPALMALCHHAELSATSIDLAKEGGATVGQIALTITCTVQTDLPD